MYPCDLRNLLVAARTDASSSTTETADTVDKTDLPDAKAGVVRQKLSAENVLRINILLSYLGLRDRTSQDVDAGIAGLPAPRASRLPAQDRTDRYDTQAGTRVSSQILAGLGDSSCWRRQPVASDLDLGKVQCRSRRLCHGEEDEFAD